MAIKGQSVTVTYRAVNGTSGAFVKADSANHVLRLFVDGSVFTPTNAPAEVSAQFLTGMYSLVLAGTEMNCNFIAWGGTSTTSNVVLVGGQMATERGILPGTSTAGALGGLITGSITANTSLALVTSGTITNVTGTVVVGGFGTATMVVNGGLHLIGSAGQGSPWPALWLDGGSAGYPALYVTQPNGIAGNQALPLVQFLAGSAQDAIQIIGGTFSGNAIKAVGGGANFAALALYGTNSAVTIIGTIQAPGAGGGTVIVVGGTINTLIGPVVASTVLDKAGYTIIGGTVTSGIINTVINPVVAGTVTGTVGVTVGTVVVVSGTINTVLNPVFAGTVGGGTVNVVTDPVVASLVLAGTITSVTNAVTLNPQDTFGVGTGLVVAAGSQTITLGTTMGTYNDLLVGGLVRIYDGTAAGQARTLTNFSGASGLGTVDRPWQYIPSTTEHWALYGVDNPALNSLLQVTFSGTASINVGTVIVVGGTINTVLNPVFAGTVGGGTVNNVTNPVIASMVLAGTITQVIDPVVAGTVLGTVPVVIGTVIVVGGTINTVLNPVYAGTVGGGTITTVTSVTNPVVAGTVSDKIGYSVISGTINTVTNPVVAGTVTGTISSVVTITNPVVVGTNLDKAGYTVIGGTITSLPPVSVATVTDKSGYTISGGIVTGGTVNVLTGQVVASMVLAGTLTTLTNSVVTGTNLDKGNYIITSGTVTDGTIQTVIGQVDAGTVRGGTITNVTNPVVAGTITGTVAVTGTVSAGGGFVTSVTNPVLVGTNQDKGGYIIIGGTVTSGTITTVTGPVYAGTVGGGTINTVVNPVVAATVLGQVITGTNLDKGGYIIIGGTVTSGTITNVQTVINVVDPVQAGTVLDKAGYYLGGTQFYNNTGQTTQLPTNVSNAVLIGPLVGIAQNNIPIQTNIVQPQWGAMTHSLTVVDITGAPVNLGSSSPRFVVWTPGDPPQHIFNIDGTAMIVPGSGTANNVLTFTVGSVYATARLGARWTMWDLNNNSLLGEGGYNVIKNLSGTA